MSYIIIIIILIKKIVYYLSFANNLPRKPWAGGDQLSIFRGIFWSGYTSPGRKKVGHNFFESITSKE